MYSIRTLFYTILHSIVVEFYWSELTTPSVGKFEIMISPKRTEGPFGPIEHKPSEVVTPNDNTNDRLKKMS